MGNRIRRFISARTAPAFLSRISGWGKRPKPDISTGRRRIPMNPGANSMWSRTVKTAVIVTAGLWSGAALAIEPCHRGVPDISLIEGSSSPPGRLAPDAETLHPNGKLQEHRWHNLHVAQRPALSRCRRKSAMGLQLWKFQAAVTASRHVLIAAARKVRCVWAEMRWRWTLKVL